MSDKPDSGSFNATGVVKVAPTLLLLVYKVLQFVPSGLQSAHITYTLFPFPAIAGTFDNVPAVLLISIGVLNVLPPSILAEKNISGSVVGTFLKSCHTT